ncbi:MAG: hypothetical protein CVV49_20405 [Spirochaetae bacterium HGW-Spirochaetae-5]|nr:MAG: hypothetical protein CVV49_20405 [Spirochaetae bacterium HGW-Spirochaetae-5]
MKKSFIIKILLVLMFAATAPLSLFAAAETHDGFYFNLMLGGGYDQSTIQYSDSSDVDYSGLGTMFKIKLGGAPVEDFILYGVFGYYDLEGPKVTVGSESATFNNLYLVYAELGGGFCYYFMPDNYFVSTELTVTSLTVGNDDAVNENDKSNGSDIGWALTLSLGKEWWVSDNWGVGVAVVATVGSVAAGEGIVNEENKNDKILHTYLGVAFTATYN